MKMGDAVKHLGGRFSAYTIRRWCENGWVVGAVKSPGGQWDIPKAGLEQCVAHFSPHRRKKIRAIGQVREVDKQDGG